MPDFSEGYPIVSYFCFERAPRHTHLDARGDNKGVPLMADETPPQTMPEPLTPNAGGGYNDPNEALTKLFAPRDTGAVRSLDDVAYAGAIQINQGDVAEGSNLPPMQHGDFRIQPPQNFRVVQNITGTTGTGNVYTLAWQDLIDSSDGLNQAKVDRYQIYVKDALNANQQPSLVGMSAMSPCTFHLVSDAATSLTFIIQPVLSNGMYLPIERCPTCTAAVSAPYYTFTVGDVTVTINSGLPGPGGSTYTGIQVIDSSTGDSSNILTNGYEVLNHNVKIAAAMVLTAPGALPGLITAADGTGSGGITGGRRVSITGSNGQTISQRVSGGTNSLFSVREDSSSDQLDIYPSFVDASGHYEVAHTKVVGAQDTGWSNYANTQNKNANFNPATITVLDANRLLGTLAKAMFDHGLIGA